MIIGNLQNYWYLVRVLNSKDDRDMKSGWVFGAYLDLKDIDFNNSVSLLSPK